MNIDLQIAQSVTPKPIREVAGKLGIQEDALELYGKYKAKVPLSLIDDDKIKQHHLILVTAITPTPAGEGKTTVSIGLTEGLNKIGKKAAAALREPSLGPVFGIKGGATGGGHSQVIPMEDINLHFTGDFSAVEKANNLLAALIDNELHHNSLGLNLDQRQILWKRVMDMNDRALRQNVLGLGGKPNGVPREGGFDITAASEIMAILCMSKDMTDMKERFGNILVGFNRSNEPVYARQLKAPGAMAALMKDAIKPNIVQTLEHNPVFIHGGPFANIAQGTNSIIATKTALTLADYVVTEAGFGADLGAEKFLDIKCTAAGLNPEAVVIVATIRALKYHGGVALADLSAPNADAVKAGLPNLAKHIENIQGFGVQPIVAINKFAFDTLEEIAVVQSYCDAIGIRAVESDGWAKGGDGTKDLAKAVVEVIDQSNGAFTPTYDQQDEIPTKIEKVATKIYGADSVEYTAKARKELRKIQKLGLEHLPVCVAKTQKSFSDNPKLKGRPTGFNITVKEIEIAAGAGFIIPITGTMMRMPGLPKIPAAQNIDVDDNGDITGLF